MDSIPSSLSELLSLKSSSTQLNHALTRLNTCLATIALDLGDSASRSTFTKQQESFLHNVSARLIDFLARCLLRLQNHKYGDDYQSIFVQLGQTMKLLQGFLLLHPKSRLLFGLSCNMELLVTCLTLPDHSSNVQPGTPLLSASTRGGPIAASPTLASIPFDFARPSGDCTDPDPPTLSEVTLETLLCALVDAPANVEMFEEVGGVAEVVRILRGKVDGGKNAKVKALEFLYFWFYPDKNDTQPVATMPSSASQGNLREPDKASTAPRMRHISRSTSTDARLRAMLEASHGGWVPVTPSKPSRTFETTQSALSRSAIATAAASPRKRPAKVSFTGELGEDENEVLHSPQAKRHSSQYVPDSPSTSRLALSQSRVTAAKSAERRRSILGASSPARAGRAVTSPPESPTNLKRSERRLSLHYSRQPSNIERQASTADLVFRSPRPPVSPQKPAIPSSPARDARLSASMFSPSVAPSASPVAASRRTLFSSHLSERATGLRDREPDRNRDAIGRGLPESSSQTKGLFAPSMSTEDRYVPASASVPAEREYGHRRTSGQQRKHQLLRRYLGNADQLVERFDGLRNGLS